MKTLFEAGPKKGGRSVVASYNSRILFCGELSVRTLFEGGPKKGERSIELSILREYGRYRKLKEPMLN